jgi:hypothetical protein
MKSLCCARLSAHDPPDRRRDDQSYDDTLLAEIIGPRGKAGAAHEAQEVIAVLGVGMVQGDRHEHGAQSPKAAQMSSATFLPEYCCCPVIRFMSRTANALNSPAWM